MRERSSESGDIVITLAHFAARSEVLGWASNLADLGIDNFAVAAADSKLADVCAHFQVPVLYNASLTVPLRPVMAHSGHAAVGPEERHDGHHGSLRFRWILNLLKLGGAQTQPRLARGLA